MHDNKADRKWFDSILWHQRKLLSGLTSLASGSRKKAVEVIIISREEQKGKL